MRAYEKTYQGLKALTETWMKDLPADILRTVKTRTGGNPEKGFANMEAKKDWITQLRVIAATQPRLTSVPKKKTDLMEVAIGGGTIDEQLESLHALQNEKG